MVHKILRPRLQLLDQTEAEAIVGEAMSVLERVGVVVENDAAQTLLLEAGAKQRADRMHLSENLVRSALESAPSRIRLFDREGNEALDLGADRLHFDPGSAALYITEMHTRDRRLAQTDDVIRLARLVEGLPHYAAQSTALVPADVAPELADRVRLYLVLRNSRKPIVTGTFTTSGFAPMLAMLTAVRGGAEALADKPLAVFDCCPNPPLRWGELTTQTLLDCARARVPATLLAMPLTGATGPVTLRETIVQHCAENLAGLAIHQLANPGAPVLYGGAPAAFDMRRGTTPMGAIESMMIQVGHVQVGAHLGLPTHAYLVTSDAKGPDYQAGFESGFGAILAALAGINLTSGPGMLDFLLTQSLEKVLLDHDLCAQALRLARGIAAYEDSSALALLAELVGKKSLLGHEHTRKYWRQELSLPSALIDRDSHGDWRARGAHWAHERAQAKLEERLRKHEIEPLPEASAAALEEILRAEGAPTRWSPAD